jgi:DNA/RNA endonuclease G (NUC1)
MYKFLDLLFNFNDGKKINFERSIFYGIFIFFFSLLICNLSFGQLRDSVRVKNKVFSVIYSEKLEQPIWLKYRSTNRPTNVNRGSMDFYGEKLIKTSDNEDYKNNIYDKGHIAPAATFSDNMENLKQTFSYLNSALQDQYLNRGEWRLLEEQERKWDDLESLTVIVKVFFDKTSKTLPTGATVPSYFQKHIFFEKQKKWKCFVFLNEKPKFAWEQLEMVCEPKDHK